MDLPQSSERFQASAGCLPPRWRPTTEYMGHVQQVSPVGMVGGGSGGGVGGGESKFMVDDSVLTDLMDLDPLNEQLLGEPWMGGNHGEHMNNYLGYPPSSSAPMYSTPSSQALHMCPQPNAPMAASLQAFQQEYLLQQVLDSSSQQQSMSVAGSALPPFVPISAGPATLSYGAPPLGGRNWSPSTSGAPSHMHLSNPKLGGAPGLVMLEGVNGSGDLNRHSPPVFMDRNGIELVQGGRSGYVPGAVKSSALEFRNAIGDASVNDRDEEKSSLSTVEGKPVSSGNLEAGGLNRARTILRSPPPPLMLLRDRIMQALRLIGRSRSDVLVQTWMPVVEGNKKVLLAREQPYVLEQKNDQLSLYRTMCETFEFPTEKSEGNVLGLPGRVFALQQAEWTPNVQFYTGLEYLRVKEAQRCDIRGSLAVPVSDPVTRQCLAVIELVGRSEKVQYGSDVDIIARALQVCVLVISHAFHVSYVSLKT